MLVHLGGGVCIRGEDVLALRDIQQGLDPEAQEMVARYERQGRLRSLGPKPKTLVLYRAGAQDGCCLSCVGLRTLRKRMENPRMIELREVQHG